MALTVVEIKNAVPGDKDLKLADGNGLYLLIKKSGRKYWRYNYRFLGKQKTFSYGVYPDITLKEVRELHAEVRRKVASGVDPSYEKRVSKILSGLNQENSFESIATEFVESRKVLSKVGKSKWGVAASVRAEGRLRNYVFPYIGRAPMADVTPPEVLALLRKIESKGFYETAHRIRSLISQIYCYGIATQRCVDDPAANLSGALVPYQAVQFAAITDPSEIGGLLRAIDDYKGSALTQFALRLAPLTLVRPGELRHAEKSEFNLVDAVWTIAGDKMKTGNDHIIPLSRQAVYVVSEALKWSAPKSNYLFHANTTHKRPMSENTINSAIRRMGYSKEEMTGHGFRAMGSTLLNEQGYDENWIEVQLAHKDNNKVRAAYNRAKYLPQRAVMLQEWADYLDRLRLDV